MIASQKISVGAVILNHNDNENTLRLVAQFVDNDHIDAIVVIDNSGNTGLAGSEIVLLNPKVIFLKCSNDGYAHGNNMAIQKIKEKYGLPDTIIISNPDVEISDESIYKCIEFLGDNPDYAVVTPRMMKTDGSFHPLAGWKERTFKSDLAYSSGIMSRIIGMYHEAYSPEYWSTQFSDVDCVTGSFFLVRGDLFEKVGFFDEHTFLFYEEDILGFKIKRLGYREAVLNYCTFIHHEGVSAGRRVNYLRKYCIMQRSRLYFHRKYTRLNPFQYFILIIVTGIGFCENLLKTILF